VSSEWTNDSKRLRAAARYTTGSVTLGEAANEAGLTTVEMMELLAGTGFRSNYSWKDFERAQEMLDHFLDYKPPVRAAEVADQEEGPEHSAL